MNQKFFAPIETSKLLKKAGYPDYHYCYWMVREGMEPEIVNVYEKDCYEEEGTDATFVPTAVYHEIQRWLDIMRDISLTAEYNQQTNWNYNFEIADTINGPSCYMGGGYATREQALNAGILSILDILISKRSKKGL